MRTRINGRVYAKPGTIAKVCNNSHPRTDNEIAEQIFGIIKHEKHVRDVYKLITNIYAIPPRMYFAAGRKQPYCEARQVTAWVCRQLMPEVSLRMLGDFFAKDHATIRHGARTVNDLMDTDRNFKSKCNLILELCRPLCQS